MGNWAYFILVMLALSPLVVFRLLKALRDDKWAQQREARAKQRHRELMEAFKGLSR